MPVAVEIAIAAGVPEVGVERGGAGWGSVRPFGWILGGRVIRRRRRIRHTGAFVRLGLLVDVVEVLVEANGLFAKFSPGIFASLGDDRRFEVVLEPVEKLQAFAGVIGNAESGPAGLQGFSELGRRSGLGEAGEFGFLLGFKRVIGVDRDKVILKFLEVGAQRMTVILNDGEKKSLCIFPHAGEHKKHFSGVPVECVWRNLEGEVTLSEKCTEF